MSMKALVRSSQGPVMGTLGVPVTVRPEGLCRTVCENAHVLPGHGTHISSEHLSSHLQVGRSSQGPVRGRLTSPGGPVTSALSLMGRHHGSRPELHTCPILTSSHLKNGVLGDTRSLLQEKERDLGPPDGSLGWAIVVRVW